MTDDLVSRQELMKMFSAFVRPSNNSDFERTPTWNDAVSIAESMPSAQRWIPVTEQTLPKHNSVVVVCGEKGTWDFGTYRGHTPNRIDFWNWKKNTVKEVHWWMYKADALPLPWKGGAE